MIESKIPNILKKGDTIGLISPSSDISKEDLEVINNSIMLMEVAGFNIKFAKNALKNTLGYGGTGGRVNTITIMNGSTQVNLTAPAGTP